MILVFIEQNEEMQFLVWVLVSTPLLVLLFCGSAAIDTVSTKIWKLNSKKNVKMVQVIYFISISIWKVYFSKSNFINFEQRWNWKLHLLKCRRKLKNWIRQILNIIILLVRKNMFDIIGFGLFISSTSVFSYHSDKFNFRS